MNQFELLYFIKKTAAPAWKLENPEIPFCDLTFILDGEAVYTSGGKSYVLRAGDAIFLPAGSERYAQTNGMQCAAFNFNSQAAPFSGVTQLHWQNDPVLNSYFNDFDLAWITKTESDIMKCDGLFLLILSRLMELQQENSEFDPEQDGSLRRQSPHVRQIKNYIHRHFTEKITVHMIADHMNLSPVYCGSLFAKETGETILNYTNRLRIIRAKELLLCTNDPVSQIAADVGIEDLFYFSRVFKKVEGVSPLRFRGQR